MGVTKNCRDPAPNLYKQCTAPIHREGEIGSQFRAHSELRVSPRVAGEVKNSSELRVERVRSESSIRQDDFVNCAWPDYNQQLNIGTLRIPDRYVNKSRDKQTFKSNQESLIASLTLSL